MAASTVMSTTGILPSAAATRSRWSSAQTQAEASTSAPTGLARSSRLRATFSATSGRAIGRPPPAPEHIAHWLTWSTSRNSSPGMARRILRGDSQMPRRLLSRHGSW